MPKIYPDMEQGSAEWLAVRLGKVTASELGNLVTPTFEIRKGEMPKSYLYAKLAEAWRGQPLPGFTGSWATEQGAIREDEAWAWFDFENEEKLHRVGFVESDDGRCGCSPDGLLGDDGGLELKAPESVNHLRYLLEGELPKDYAAQVHGCLYVTGRKWWKFVSYRRKFPPFILHVGRDEAICSKIGEALATFYAAFDAGMAKLKQIEQVA